jgi:hypothetical protein
VHEMVAYWVPKDGTAASDWEDGAAYSRATGWFAVADGASTGNNSREWACTLTNEFIEKKADVFDDSPAGFVAWLESARTGFDPHSPEFPQSRAPRWVQTAGSVRGSHATLLAGRLSANHIQAVAVGDCCLFHLRSAYPPRSFPLAVPADFGTSPALVGSQQTNNDLFEATLRHYHQTLSPGDIIFVASDALAEWLTKNLDQPRVWRLLSRIGHQGFGDLCRDLRAARQMKNDDVTLFRARVPMDNRGKS